MKRLLCCLRGHALRPTGRRGSLLTEWHCTRCGRRFISHVQARYVGWLFPRGHYDGLRLTVFPADRDSDLAMGEIQQIKDAGLRGEKE